VKNAIRIIIEEMANAPDGIKVGVVMPTIRDEVRLTRELADSLINTDLAGCFPRVVNAYTMAPFEGFYCYHILIVDGDRMNNLEEVIRKAKCRAEHCTLIWSETREEIDCRTRFEEMWGKS